MTRPLVFLFLFVASFVVSAEMRVRTLAGSQRGPGHADGTGSAARFSSPYRIAIACDGSIVIAARGEHTIRRVTLSGEATTLAGVAWKRGHADGAAARALFAQPEGVAVAPDCSIVVADRANNAVRRISSGGVVTTVAAIAGPYDVAVDSSGSIYVAAGKSVHRIAADGTASTLATSFANARGLDIGAGGELAVVDNDGVTRALWAGSPQSLQRVPGTDVGSPLDVTFDGNDFILSDQWGVVRRVTRGGASQIITGSLSDWSHVDGPVSSARVDMPVGIAQTNGTIFFTDRSHTLRMIRDGVVSTLAGQVRERGVVDGPAAEARFYSPQDVAEDALGNVYVLDGAAIRKISPEGIVSTFAGSVHERGDADGIGTAARFRSPVGIAVDGAGNLYIADTSSHVIRRVTPAGAVSTWAGATGATGTTDGPRLTARFNSPYGIAATSDGTLFVADTLNHTIRRITPDGTVSTIAGRPGFTGSGDGPASGARFNTPVDVDFDDAGNVYIVDENNSVVQKIANGEVSTVGATRRGARSWGIAAAPDGTVYSADTESMFIRRLTATENGAYVGREDEPGAVTGKLDEARLNQPYGVDIGPSGLMFIADSGNSAIRVVEEVPLPVITSFTAEPDVISLGNRTRLSWSVTGATRVTLNGGEVASAGTLETQPTATTKYVLIATNEHGSIERTVIVYIRGPRRRAV